MKKITLITALIAACFASSAFASTDIRESMGLNASATQRPIILADSSEACRKQCDVERNRCEVMNYSTDSAKNDAAKRECGANYRACVSSCRGD